MRVPALWYPLFGAAVGAAGGYALDAGRGYFPFSVLALLVLAWFAAMRGGWMENAACGVSAVVLAVLIRWQALSSIAADPAPALAAALAVSHAAVVAVAWTTPPAASGDPAKLTATLSTPVALAAIAQGVLLALLPGPRASSYLIGGALAIAVISRAFLIRKSGGLNQATLGACGYILETYCLLVFACRPCVE